MVPPDWFIDDLMAFLKRPYYVGLLTAAAMHGSGHQQPQEYQVVVSSPERSIKRGNLNIRFYQKKSMGTAPQSRLKSYTGYFTISTPAATALDLVRFSSAIGGLDTVLTVLQDLTEKIAQEDLIKTAQNESDLSLVQRLGWLLDQTHNPAIADGLARWLLSKKPCKTLLDVRSPVTGGRKDPRWQVIVNADPKSET
jgi:predicted transcriptional regulator of viral defense system